MSGRTKRRAGARAVDLLEESVHLLRLAPGSLLAVYYLGGFPFVLGLLYFWTDMSRSALADEHHSTAAWGVAFLYVWMKGWHGVFAGLLHERVRGEAGQRWPLGRLTQTAALQALIQPSGLFVLPIAFILTLPFGWACAFYQTATVLSSEPGADWKAVIRRASQQAQLWPGQNHLLLSLIGLFGLVVFLNLGIVLLQLPSLVETTTGIESIFSRSGLGMLNTTFLMAVLGLTYLCVDPLVKAVYVLRCFYGQSVESGEDLRVVMRGSFAGRTIPHGAVLAVALGAILGGLERPALAQPAAPRPPTDARAPARTRGVSVPELDRALQEAIAEREFTWRLPRVRAERPRPSSFFAMAMDSMIESIWAWAKKTLRFLRDIVERVFEFIFKRLAPPRQSAAAGTGWMAHLQVLLYLLLALVSCALAIVVFRIWQRRAPKQEPLFAQPVSAAPDLTDQNTSADRLPEDGWLKLAQELLDRGELRLALRALYLAGLAHLGRRELIRIAQFKSNREYQLELRRRSPAQPALQSAFAEAVGIIDRVWYGMDEVNLELVAAFREHLGRIIEC